MAAERSQVSTAGDSPRHARTDGVLGALVDRAANEPDRIAYRFEDLGIWNSVSWRTLARRVEHLAAGLERLGIERGDRVAFLTDPTPHWLALDLAVQALGAIPYSMYPSAPREEIEDLLRRGGARAAVVLGHEEFERVLEVADRCSSLEHLVVTDPRGMSGERDGARPAQILVETLEREGSAGDPVSLAERVEVLDPDSSAAIVFSAGVAGSPRPMTWTASALIGAVNRWAAGGFADSGLHEPDGRDRMVAELPVAHVAGRMFQGVLPLTHGVVLHFPEGVAGLRGALRAVSPTISVAPGRAWRLAAERLESAVNSSGWVRRSIVRRAVACRTIASESSGWRRVLGTVASVLLGPVVVRPALSKLGTASLRAAHVVDAGLPHNVARAWKTWGVELTDAYSTAELGVVALGPAARGDRFRRPLTLLEGVDARVAEGGELLVRVGDASVGVDDSRPVDVWTRTGDLGEVDGGTISVLGPVAGVITPQGGESVDAWVVERVLTNSPYILGAIVATDDGDLEAIIEPALGALRDRFGSDREIGTAPGELLTTTAAQTLLRDEVVTANRQLAEAGLPSLARVSVLTRTLDPQAGDPVTPTRKPKRGVTSLEIDSAGILLEVTDVASDVGSDVRRSDRGADHPAAATGDVLG